MGEKNNDVVIPIVFPDYSITVDTPALTVGVPDLLPGVNILPDRLTFPATRRRVGYLGHAGVLFINGTSGRTRYFEYGRYDLQAKGLVRHQMISDVAIDRTGHPDRVTLAKALGEISVRSGQHGRIEGVYIELPAGAFMRMQVYAEARERANTNPARAPYDLLSNSCLHFMRSTAEAGGARVPDVIAPNPAGYIIQFQIQERTLRYSARGLLTIE